MNVYTAGFQHSVTQRNATPRSATQEFLRNKKVLYATAETPQRSLRASCGGTQVNRNEFYF